MTLQLSVVETAPFAFFPLVYIAASHSLTSPLFCGKSRLRSSKWIMEIIHDIHGLAVIWTTIYFPPLNLNVCKLGNFDFSNERCCIMSASIKAGFCTSQTSLQFENWKHQVQSPARKTNGGPETYFLPLILQTIAQFRVDSFEKATPPHFSRSGVDESIDEVSIPKATLFRHNIIKPRKVHILQLQC